jgi:dipeptidyl aminopeptidase/acylaminoacyl peptidase
MIPMAGGEPRQIAPAEADQTGAAWSPDGRNIVYVENHNGTHDLRIVDASGSEPIVLVAPEVGVVADPDWSPGGELVSFTMESMDHPKDLYVVFVETREKRQLTHSMPEGNLRSRLLTPEKISYPSSEGLEIPAYLYRPQHIEPGQKFPAIVWTHGGPTSQYNDTFHRDAQFFAQRGYVVLLPNIRGSSGYGDRFEKMNNRCWGHCDLEDVEAGVEYLKTLPYVNRDKMGTTGTSYGGFMTCAAIAFAPDLFQAAVAASGYCNRVSFVDEGEFRHIQQLAYEFGPFEENKELYRRNSPYFSIDKIRTPTFLLHGEGRYPGSGQMREFARVMQNQYKTFRYKAYAGENYYVRGTANTRDMLTDMLHYFDFYLKDVNAELPGVTHLEELGVSK